MKYHRNTYSRHFALLAAKCLLLFPLLAGGAASAIHSADDLGLDIGSAVDLVGPVDSQAGGMRNALKNQINDHYNSKRGGSTLGVQKPIARDAGRYKGDGTVGKGVFTIAFPDESRIKVRLDNILPPLDHGEFQMELEVLTDTAQGPGLPAVPQGASEFSDFQYSGNAVTAQSLADLAIRYGLGVGPNLVCNFSCSAGPGSSCTLTCQRFP